MHYIVYVELQGFYVRAIGMQEGLAAVHAKGRIIDSSAEARAHQVTEGLSLNEAKLLLRDRGVFIEYQRSDYTRDAARWLDRLLTYTGAIQPISPAGALVDLSAHPRPSQIAALMLSDLHREEKLPIRAGIAPNAWLAARAAELCSAEAMSLGLLPIEPIANAAEWLKDKPISWLRPLLASDRERLERLGVSFVGEVQELSDRALQQQFGKRAPLVREAAIGRPCNPITSSWPKDSLSDHVSLEKCDSRLKVEDALTMLAMKASLTLRAKDQVAQSISLYLADEDGRAWTAERPFSQATQAAGFISTSLRQLFASLRIDRPLAQARILLSGLSQAPLHQAALGFDEKPQQSSLSAVMQRLNTAQGARSIKPASSIKLTHEQRVMSAWRETHGWT